MLQSDYVVIYAMTKGRREIVL